MPDLLSLPTEEMRDIASREAVATLGLLRPEATTIIASLISDSMVEHPRAICLGYRKTGEQVAALEKKALGIRPNAFLSVAAHADLTAAGRKRALVAHEITLLRATFTLNRRKSVLQAMTLEATHKPVSLRFNLSHHDCAQCIKLNGKLLPLDDAFVLPHKGCRCETASYSLNPKVDWLAGVR